MYNIHVQMPYEGEHITYSGDRDQILNWFREGRGGYDLEDLYITQDADIDVYEMQEEANTK